MAPSAADFRADLDEHWLMRQFLTVNEEVSEESTKSHDQKVDSQIAPSSSLRLAAAATASIIALLKPACSR